MATLDQDLRNITVSEFICYFFGLAGYPSELFVEPFLEMIACIGSDMRSQTKANDVKLCNTESFDVEVNKVANNFGSTFACLPCVENSCGVAGKAN